MRQVAASSFPGAGPAPVFGGASATPLAAAFSNAAIAHLREIDDAHRAAMLHPGVVAISPVLALAAAQPLTQGQAIAGIVAGYEVALRVGEAMGTRHAALFHATATAGALGAAAAASVALGLPRTQLHHALGLAATQSAGLWQLIDDEAHESKSLHPAFAVRNGMMAAWGAQAGLPGARAFVTGKRGLYALLAGEGPLAALHPGADEPDRLNTATIKAWPTCAQLFTPLDALRELLDEHRFAAAQVESVRVVIFPHALKIAGVDWPARPSETMFCLRYVLATLMREGRLGIKEMELPALDDPDLRSLADRIHVTTSEAFQKLFPERRPAEVTVTLHGGESFSRRRDLRRGDPEDPFTWTQLLHRMRAFAPAMDDAAAHAVTGWCEGFADPSMDILPCLPRAALFGCPG
jgi:2-methylcitrate dehydratase PrpD